MANQNLQLYYFGKAYPLEVFRHSDIKKTTLSFKENHFEISTSEMGQLNLHPYLMACYSKLLNKPIHEFIRHYQSHFKVKPSKITIEDSAVRLGSCNHKRELTFNWQLGMMPTSVLEYVVVHEMCHMVHLNHDRSFWRLVGKLYPDYKAVMAMIGSEKRPL